MPSIADFDALENPYRPSPYAGREPVPDGGAVQMAELQAFVGHKFDYYLRKWAPRLTSVDGDVGMNWTAFFLTVIWMGYRKMYRTAMVCIGAAIGLSILIELLFVFAFRTETTPPLVNALFNLMFALVCGLFGNAWYLAHARRKIAAERARGLEGEQLLFALQQRGGTSMLGAFGLVFGPLVILLVLGLVLGVAIALAGDAGM